MTTATQNIVNNLKILRRDVLPNVRDFVEGINEGAFKDTKLKYSVSLEKNRLIGGWKITIEGFDKDAVETAHESLDLATGDDIFGFRAVDKNGEVERGKTSVSIPMYLDYRSVFKGLK